MGNHVNIVLTTNYSSIGVIVIIINEVLLIHAIT
jgi:hypothetical protein